MRQARTGRRFSPKPYRVAFTVMPVQAAMNAQLSAASAITLSVGLPDPWPARVSMRIRWGLGPDLRGLKRARCI